MLLLCRIVVPALAHPQPRTSKRSLLTPYGRAAVRLGPPPCGKTSNRLKGEMLSKLKLKGVNSGSGAEQWGGGSDIVIGLLA